MYTEKSTVLTDTALLVMLRSAVTKAEEIGQPQCIVIVDASGVTLSQFRMQGAKYLSLKSAEAKARTAASIRAATDSVPEAVRPAIAAATGGQMTGLGGGLPIFADGFCIGGIGVGSGAPDQDVEVGLAALTAIGLTPTA
ncbi:MAG: heme-binding protein [Pseudomonadota bacterium]